MIFELFGVCFVFVYEDLVKLLVGVINNPGDIIA